MTVPAPPPLLARLETDLRDYAREAKTDQDLARAALPSTFLAFAEAMGGAELVAEFDRHRERLAKVARLPPLAPMCKRGVTCGRRATWEVWDGLAERRYPWCEECARAQGFGPLEMQRIGGRSA